jgi:hypothetical protein
MVPPRWPDEPGRPIPTYPCPRCSREVASRFKGFRVENLWHVGWQLFRPATYVNWCGHAQEIIPMPLADGRVTSLLSRDPFRDLRDDLLLDPVEAMQP